MMGKLMGFLGLENEETEEEEKVEEIKDDFFPSKRAKGNIVSLHSQKNIKVILHEPSYYDEAQGIADHLRSHRPVIVNLQKLNAESARRMVDFLSGCVYALNGEIKKIGIGIFLCTPENYDVQGDISEKFEDNEEISSK